MKGPKGEGYVLETRSWLDEIRSKSETEAEEFGRRVLARYGPKCPEQWQSVYVEISGSPKVEWCENYSLKIVESREK